LLVLFVLRGREGGGGAFAAAGPPAGDPRAASRVIEQGAMVHVFDTTSLPDGPHYVNDHTLVQGPDGTWHLFGIFHREPMGDDTEVELIHAIAGEPDPQRWGPGSFEPAPAPYTIALRADRAIGETHAWAPHVVAENGRYWMVYQGGGTDDYHASIRLAESDDLYRWTRVTSVPLFEDFCEARDPMLLRRDGAWALFYTRCDGIPRKASGVAFRISHDLATWSEPTMAMTLAAPATSNSAYTESPFVFEQGGFFYLSVTAYPEGWDRTTLYRSRTPYSFPDTPFSYLRAHAAEWVFTRGGARAYVTHAGPGQRGVWLSRVGEL